MAWRTHGGKSTFKFRIQYKKTPVNNFSTDSCNPNTARHLPLIEHRKKIRTFSQSADSMLALNANRKIYMSFSVHNERASSRRENVYISSCTVDDDDEVFLKCRLTDWQNRKFDQLILHVRWAKIASRDYGHIWSFFSRPRKKQKPENLRINFVKHVLLGFAVMLNFPERVHFWKLQVNRKVDILWLEFGKTFILKKLPLQIYTLILFHELSI